MDRCSAVIVYNGVSHRCDREPHDTASVHENEASTLVWIDPQATVRRAS